MAEEDAATHSHEVARGSFWGLFGTIALKIVSFAYAIYVARAFSQENVGLFYLSLSVISLIGFWRNLGLPSALQRYVPYFEAKNQGGKIISLLKISFVANALLGVMLFIMIFVLADPIGAIYKSPGLSDGLRLLAAYVLFENLYSVSLSFLQGRRDIKSYQFLNNVQNVAKLALTVILFSFFGATLFTLSAAFILAYAAVFLLSIPMLLRKASDVPSSGEAMSASEVLHDIIPFGITLTIVQSFWILISSTDRALLGYFGNPATSVETVAIYSIASQLALTIMVFPSAVGSIFLPVISRLVGKGDRSAMLKVIQTSQRWILFITIPVALATMAFAGEMLSVFYGGSYRSGANAMSIFILGLLFSTLTYPISLALAGMRLVRLELYVAIACAVVNLALNVFLIPFFGMEGASAASAAAFLISAWMFERYGRQYLSYRTPSGIYKLFAAGAVAFAAILLLKPLAGIIVSLVPPVGSGEFAIYSAKFVYLAALGVMGGIGLVIFGAVALLLRTFKHEDISLMRSAAKKTPLPQKIILFAEKIALLGVESGKRAA
ncbi:MAG: oligosaccharide flippase family protein [Candidatus Micrarchaeota archaeon]|nr:oligosaccharide flippase family protein [Candidatus Micrarchaeota archaeon]